MDNLKVSDYPVLIQRASQRFDKDYGWEWQFAIQKEKDEIDTWIVKVGHPLGFQTGTQEWRFKKLVRELASIL